MPNHNCVFIVFEGLNCSGKTTQRELLATYLSNEFTEKRRGSRSIYITSQPGATSDSYERLKCKREYALSITIDDYIRDRAYHAPYLEEALHRGDILLCSRYTASTAAYQGDLDPATIEYIHSENDRVTHGLIPDLVIYLSITPQEAMRRLKVRNRPGDDQFTLEQLQSIAAGYYAEESYCTGKGQKWLTFHAIDSVDGIADKIRDAAINLIEAKTNALPPASPIAESTEIGKLYCATCKATVWPEQAAGCASSTIVRLAFDVSRCIADDCDRADSCARALVPGGPSTGYSDLKLASLQLGEDICGFYRGIAS